MLASDLIPLATAIALSPFPIVPVILLLLTPRARANGGGFLLGWFAGLLVGTGLAAAAATVVELADEPPTWASWTRIVLGAALVVLGTKKYVTRSTTGAPPAWMESIGTYSPAQAVRLGLLLAVANPKVLLLAVAAGLTIGTAELGPATAVGAVVAFSAAAAVTVAMPVVAHLTLGDRVAHPLVSARDWLTRHNDAIVAVVLVVIGVMLVTKGVGSL